MCSSDLTSFGKRGNNVRGQRINDDNTPFGQNPDAENNTATSFGKRGNNVRGQRINDDNTIGSPHHGAGLIISNDKTGYINRFSLYGTYAYHKPLSPTTL